MQTGGLAFGDIYTKSKFLLFAIAWASLEDIIPNCSPVSEIILNSLSLIWSLIDNSLLIVGHLQIFYIKNKKRMIEYHPLYKSKLHLVCEYT